MKYSQGKDKKVIAVCLAKYDGIDQVDFVQAFKRACDKENYRIFVFSSSSDFLSDLYEEGEKKVFELLEPQRFDAVVIMTPTFKMEGLPEKIAEKTVKAGTLCFSLGVALPGCVTIRYSFEKGFELVVRHMIEHHKVKNVNFIAGHKGNVFSENRLDVFRTVCAENGITVEEDRIGYGEFWEQPTDEVMDTFLSSGKKIDAIICANDFMAMEACRKLREVGLKVPQDVLVSGFDGTELEKYHYPRLATGYYDAYDSAVKVVEVIEAYHKGESIRGDYEIDVRFRAGQSCGCIDSNDLLGAENARLDIFEAHRHLRELEANMALLSEKVQRLEMTETLSGVWGELFYLVGRYFPGVDFDLLINDDFLKEDLELWPSLRPYEKGVSRHYYTDDLRIAMKVRNGAFSNHNEMQREELLPDLDDVINKDAVTNFIPVHVQNSTIGYVSVTCDPEKIDYWMLLAFVNNLRQVLEAHKSRLDQQNLYSTDQLTKLLNRKGFYRHMEDEMEVAVSTRKPVCVISIDMNGLKTINDTYGHKEGDFALAKIGEILSDVVGDLGVCTRFGGDEFAIAFTGEDAEARCSLVIAEIRDRLEVFNSQKKKPYSLSVSLGSACHIPDTVDDMERYLMEADKRMYKNKTIFKAREAQ